MSTRVVTISTCDRCGAIVERDGECDGPPEGWALASLLIEPEIDMFLCPACVADVRFVLEDKPSWLTANPYPLLPAMPGARVPPVRQEEAPGETGQMSREGVE